MENTRKLGEESIGKLLAQFAIPAIVAMMVNAVYNIVDRIFIGQYVGEHALAGLTVIFPVTMLVVGFASLIGAGTTSIMSIKLGKDDHEGASRTFGNGISMSLMLSVIILVTLYPLMETMLVLLGATSDLMVYSLPYMNIILIGFVFQITAFLLSAAIRIEGFPIFSMASMLVGALSNIILDYIFIKILNMGVEGAALATITGQFLGFIVLIIFYMKGKSQLSFKAEYLKISFKEVKDIVSVGMTSFLATIGTCVASVFMNRALLSYGGTAAITAVGAISSLSTLYIMPMIGVQQGMQPIIGYNYGKGYIKRVNKTLKLSILLSTLFASIVFIGLKMFPQEALSLFISPDSNTMEVAVEGLSYMILLLPLLSINLMGTAYFQSIAKAREAVILGSLRQFVLLIPLVLILPNFLGLLGVWLVTPIADGLSILATTFVLLRFIKSTKDMEVVDVPVR